MTLGERCLREGILDTLYGKDQADRMRRAIRSGGRARQAEYTEAALRLEAAEAAFPAPEPRAGPVTPQGVEEMIAKAKAEMMAAVVKHYGR